MQETLLLVTRHLSVLHTRDLLIPFQLHHWVTRPSVTPVECKPYGHSFFCDFLAIKQDDAWKWGIEVFEKDELQDQQPTFVGGVPYYNLLSLLPH